MKRPYLILIAVIAVLALGSLAYAAYEYVRPVPIMETATTTPEVVAPVVHPYGQVTARLGETVRVEGLTLRPVAVLEDSRCPMNARCIWAGTVRLSLEVVSGMGTSTNSITLGESATTEAERITLVSVAPETVAGEEVAEGEYVFTFEVAKRVAAPTPKPVLGKCYVGGCSSQLCTDRPDAVSTCEYRESYGCYKSATCERQASGQCGWTPSAELTACLKSAQ